jgi:Dolichyl-phosphate-mannose-protein mannosyltransferase
VHSSILLLTIPIALSAFTHLWNPIGFPSIYIDENIYMRRAIVVLEGDGPVDKSSLYPPYDHPFFGQIFLANVFRIIGYPHPFIQPVAKEDVHSIEMLYLVPRVLMGILAVVDTFLIYKICERRYSNSKSIAFIASVLFAVMPITWLLRMTMLESIQLPFILLAVLFAIYIKKDSKDNNSKYKNIIVTLLSGIFVGLAILTKMPAIAIIPLGGYLVYTNSKDLKIVGLWFIPVILIPLIWPIYAFSIGDLKYWLEGIHLQTHRHETVYKPIPLLTSIRYLFEVDPALMILGSAAVVFAAIKRDLFLLLWSVPLVIFFYFIHSQFFLLIPILPAFCIAAAKMINGLSNTIKSKNVQNIISLSAILAIGIFGLVSITYLITTNLNSAYFQADAFVAKFLSYNDNATNNGKNKTALVGQDRYYWIPQKVLQEDQYYKAWDNIHFAKNEKAKNVLLIIDDPAKYWLTTHSQDRNNQNVRMLQTLYNNTFPVDIFEKNKSSSIGDWNHIDGQYTSKIEIRTNRTDDMLLNSSAFTVNIGNGTIVKDGSKFEIVIPVSQTGMPSYWNDFLRSCDDVFKCALNVTTAWKENNNNDDYNKTSFQLSTNTTDKNTWSWIYGNEINVNPAEQYEFITHMKLNEYTSQSHIVVEGYNNKTKQWDQITQCPSGTNGPLEWHEYSCEITIPKDIVKIRPILNAGWSSQPGKQAVTLFDAIYLNEINIKKHNSLVLNPDFVHHHGSFPRIASLCQFRGDFDIQVNYKLLKVRTDNGANLNLVAHCSRIY